MVAFTSPIVFYPGKVFITLIVPRAVELGSSLIFPCESRVYWFFISAKLLSALPLSTIFLSSDRSDYLRRLGRDYSLLLFEA